MMTRGTIPARGYLGGLAGSRREILINEEKAHPFERYILEPGDRLIIRDAGGGGFGPPEERKENRVIDDVENGFVTVTSAKQIYGVSIKETD
jgi:N-methylhydantoinase B